MLKRILIVKFHAKICTFSHAITVWTKNRALAIGTQFCVARILPGCDKLAVLRPGWIDKKTTSTKGECLLISYKSIV